MPFYTNFFWAKFFILYDPLEFSTGACPTPSGLEMAKTHHCALAAVKRSHSTYFKMKLQYMFHLDFSQDFLKVYILLLFLPKFAWAVLVPSSRPCFDGPELNLTPASASFCVPSENFANSEDSSHEIIETFA